MLAGPADLIYAATRTRMEAYSRYAAFHRAHFERERAAEAALSRRGGTKTVLYVGANAPASASVATRPMFLDMYNFHKSFVDPLGLNARQRQLLLEVRARKTDVTCDVALFEHGTGFHRALKRSGLRVASSHCAEDANDPHRQDMQRLEYANGRFDMAIHADVLEHVPIIMPPCGRPCAFSSWAARKSSLSGSFPSKTLFCEPDSSRTAR